MLPGNGIVPGVAAVTLNVFVPVLNNVGITPLLVSFASLKKNAPKRSPQLSEIRSILSTIATAPLVSPTNCAPTTT